MNGAHLPFILAAYGITVLVVGATVAATLARYRALRRALARFGDDGRDR